MAGRYILKHTKYLPLGQNIFTFQSNTFPNIFSNKINDRRRVNIIHNSPPYLVLMSQHRSPAEPSLDITVTDSHPGSIVGKLFQFLKCIFAQLCNKQVLWSYPH